MLTLKRSSVMTNIFKQPILHCRSSYSCNFRTNEQNIKKQTHLDMTANSSSRLCLPLCKGKTKEYLSVVVAPKPCQTHTGHWNTKSSQDDQQLWLPILLFCFVLFFKQQHQVKQDWERKKHWRHLTKNGPITTSSYLIQGLKTSTS